MKSGQLKEVYGKSQSVVNQLMREKGLCVKEDNVVRQQMEESQKKRDLLQEKGSELEDRLRGEIAQKEKFIGKKVALEENILKMEEEYQKVCGQLTKAEAWKKETAKTAEKLE